MGSPPSVALAKRSFDSALMLPPPVPKRQKRPSKVLNEDAYSQAISHIVARDYFPGLSETEAQQEYMEALDSNDDKWILEASRKLTQVMTPGPESRRRHGRGTSFTPRQSMLQSETPRGFVGHTPQWTPRSMPTDDFAPEGQPEVDVSLSLGAFQAKYTSEDNESFNALLDEQNEKRAAKHAFFLTGNQIPSARRISSHSNAQRISGESDSSGALVTINATGEETQITLASRPSMDLDARLASVDNFPNKQGPKNPLMFGPDSVEDHFTTYQQRAAMASNAPPKAVRYSATRFQAQRESEGAIPPSPSISAIDAAIAGRPKATASVAGYTGAETPRVNGYAFVDEEPTPSELGIPVTDSEADTAEREAAKQFLPQVDEGGPGRFNIRERSKRESLHYKLVEKADASRRKAGKAGHVESLGITCRQTPTPRLTGNSMTKKSLQMTPAAARLASKIGTPKRGASVFEPNRKLSTPDGLWKTTPQIKRKG